MPDTRTTADVLRAARAKITPEGAWTQRELARTADGSPDAPDNPLATCWCAIGAIESLTNETYALRALYLMGVDDIAKWNDAPGRTQAEVLALFDRAIAAEQARTQEGRA